MWIPEFICGVVATIVVEIVIVGTWVVRRVLKTMADEEFTRDIEDSEK